ncbi:hypothetical protein CPB86DRAFT_820255 [Serendipita vermifera]|nr:hypothetical protein CPB86DRAFT_820255 [Serendipita vermifera]
MVIQRVTGGAIIVELSRLACQDARIVCLEFLTASASNRSRDNAANSNGNILINLAPPLPAISCHAYQPCLRSPLSPPAHRVKVERNQNDCKAGNGHSDAKEIYNTELAVSECGMDRGDDGNTQYQADLEAPTMPHAGKRLRLLWSWGILGMNPDDTIFHAAYLYTLVAMVDVQFRLDITQHAKKDLQLQAALHIVYAGLVYSSIAFIFGQYLLQPWHIPRHIDVQAFSGPWKFRIWAPFMLLTTLQTLSTWHAAAGVESNGNRKRLHTYYKSNIQSQALHSRIPTDNDAALWPQSKEIHADTIYLLISSSICNDAGQALVETSAMDSIGGRFWLLWTRNVLAMDTDDDIRDL